jgi:hypothetical protein
MRRISLVGVFMLIMLALATHVTVAHADVTQTAITSPSGTDYYYDASSGAYGGFTVTGTTNSTDPSSDSVDIDCYENSGSGPYDAGTLVSGVPLDASGSFSTPVSYSDIEQYYSVSDDCQLAAVSSSDTSPPTDLSAYTGPRVLLAELSPYYGGEDQSDLTGYDLWDPQLGAEDDFSDLADCGLSSMALTVPGGVGYTTDPAFECADAIDYGSNNLEVDSEPVVTAEEDYDLDTPISLSVSATQDPSNGDMTIDETEPLDKCSDDACDSYIPSGVTDDRVIHVTNDGKLVVITDTFESSDGQSHQVTDEVASETQLTPCCMSVPLTYEIPGQPSSVTNTPNTTVDVAADAPGTIYAYNPDYPDGSTAEGRAALTYFTAPTGGTVSFDGNGYLDMPYTLNVPAGGAVSLSLAYATEYSQSGFAGAAASALDIQAPPTLVISSPTGGSSTHSSAVTVSGLATAASGVKSVVVNGVGATLSGSSFSASVPLVAGTNTIDATVTTNSGAIASTSETVTYDPPGVEPQLQTQVIAAIWHPIANTGVARRAGKLKEKLTGRVTAGSAGVSYYFQYGTHGHYNRRSKVMGLAAGKSSREVALAIHGLTKGKTYGYRLVASGKYGHAMGARRTFKVAKRGNH